MIDKLEFLLALARERHFGRAAEVCGVTQPTMSAAIKQLEDTLGVLLVQRGSRFIGLTPEGEHVLEWAKRIVGDARAMRDEITSLKKGLSGHLRIASIPTALGMVATLTTDFCARHPEVKFTVLSRRSNEVLTLLDELEIHAGITYLDNEPLGHVNQVPLYHEHYCLFIAPDHPLAGKDKITWKEIGNLPLGLLTPDMQNRRIIDRHLGHAGFKAAPKVESDSMLTLYSHVKDGHLASVMPAKYAEAIGADHGIRIIPIVESEATNLIGLVVPHREPMTPLTAALVETAKKIAPQLGG
jgi:DNA-binding transcriptional LysR family regulator